MKKAGDYQLMGVALAIIGLLLLKISILFAFISIVGIGFQLYSFYLLYKEK